MFWCYRGSSDVVRRRLIARVVCKTGGGLRRGACNRRQGPTEETDEERGGVGRVLTGLRLADLVVLITVGVVQDTPLDCHFSAWSRPKPAPDPLPGPSVASGVIPTKGGRSGVFQPPPGRAPEGRWRSSPWKRCNHAPPRSRGQGAPRTARCIKTAKLWRCYATWSLSGTTPHR